MGREKGGGVGFALAFTSEVVIVADDEADIFEFRAVEGFTEGSANPLVDLRVVFEGGFRFQPGDDVVEGLRGLSTGCDDDIVAGDVGFVDVAGLAASDVDGLELATHRLFDPLDFLAKAECYSSVLALFVEEVHQGLGRAV
jgi:hypothetical protein